MPKLKPPQDAAIVNAYFQAVHRAQRKDLVVGLTSHDFVARHAKTMQVVCNNGDVITFLEQLKQYRRPKPPSASRNT